MSKYYSLRNINKKNAVYNMIIGERSNGKTYATLKYGLEQFFKDRSQIAVVRRWKEDIRASRVTTLFNGHIENGEIEKLSNGEYAGVTFYNGAFYVCNYDEETGRPIYNENDRLGYAFALSDMEHNKSLSYPNIRTIIFDEFLTKHLYLNDEFVLFMNTISTIVRKRTDVKIYMLGNTVSKYSPYFEEMGLNHVQDMEQGTIDVYSYGDSKLTVAVEYCKSNDSSKENSFYFAFNNPKLAMITGGAWEMDMYPHLPIKYTPKNVLLEYYIDFNDKLYTCEIVLVGEVTFTYIHRKTTDLHHNKNDIIYTTEHYPDLNYSRNIFKPINKVQERIKWYYMTDRVYYQNNSVGDEINTMLKIMSKQ